MVTKHTLKGQIATRQVWLDGHELDPKPSQKMINHSPDGFNWGYGGSGPAQLALAIILELNSKCDGYQQFKWDFIAELPMTDFEVKFEFPLPEPVHGN